MSATLIDRPLWRLVSGPMYPYSSMVPNGAVSVTPAVDGEEFHGETHAISPGSTVALSDERTASLGDLMGDRRFALHLPRLGFTAVRGKTARWSEPMAALGRMLDALVPNIQDRIAQADILQSDRLAIRSHHGAKGLLSGYRAAIKTLTDIGYALEHNPFMQLHVDSCVHFHALCSLMEEMSSTIPPVRVYVPPSSAPDAAALLLVTVAEAGAELFLGLNGKIKNTDVLDRIKRGGGTLYPHLHTVDARAGNIVVIPPYTPFGMGGGMRYVMITPGGSETPCVDSWQQCLRTELWQGRSEGFIDGVGARGIVRRGMLAEAAVDSGRHTLIDKLAFAAVDGDAGQHYASETLHVSLVKLPKRKINSTFMHAQGVPIAMLMLNGGMTVLTSRGPDYFFTGGDNALFPATTSDGFAFQALDGSAVYMMVSAPPVGSGPLRHKVVGDLGGDIVTIQPFPHEQGGAR